MKVGFSPFQAQQSPRRLFRPKTTATIISSDLRDLGISALPERRPNTIDQGLGWQTMDDQFKVLKTIEFLLTKSKKIENDMNAQNDNFIDPLSSKTKQQESRIKQLNEKEESLDEQIKEAKRQLAKKKAERETLKNKYAKELSDLDQQIANYQRRR